MTQVCKDCREIPDLMKEVEKIVLSAPLQHTAEKLEKKATESGLKAGQVESKDLAMVTGKPGSLNEFICSLGDDFSRQELEETHLLVFKRGETADLKNFHRVTNLASFGKEFEGDWLRDLLEENRLVTQFQPIVNCKAPEEIYGNECLLRGSRDENRLIPPGELFETARDTEMLFYLDHEARLNSIRAAVENNPAGKIFINFNPTSIYDPDYCLKSTIEAIGDTSLEPESIVFEVVESDRIDDLEKLIEILARYRKAGFGVALDDFGAGMSTMDVLHELQPDYLKIDMKLVRGVDKGSYKSKITTNLLEMARDLDIKSIVEGVETGAELNWFQENGADLAQGFYFAKPDCPPPPVNPPG